MQNNQNNELVFIVEDEPLILEDLRQALVEDGFAVTGAGNGASAADIPDLRTIDLLIADIRVEGGTSGLDIARIVREGRPDIPIIFASARLDDHGMAEMIQRNFDPPIAIVTKPYLPSRIPGIARRLLADQHLWRSEPAPTPAA